MNVERPKRVRNPNPKRSSNPKKQRAKKTNKRYKKPKNNTYCTNNKTIKDTPSLKTKIFVHTGFKGSANFDLDVRIGITMSASLKMETLRMLIKF